MHSWRPELEYGGQSGQHEESLYGDDDSEDSLLYEHFDGQQEDLRDVTLSDMMKRHLAMLSDNESDTSLHGSDQVVSGELQAESECESNDLHLADMTFADRTFQFMSKLELDFDSVAQDSPSLLTETIPENSFGDMTFIIYPTETAESTTRAVETTTARNHIQSNQQDRNQQSSHLPTENVQKESILDEFLKTLPPLPKSPDSKRLPPNVQTRSAVTTTLFRASNSPPSRGGGRTVPLPAPIITSRERCRQIMRERSNAPSDQKRAAQQQYRQSSLKYSKSVTSILGESSSPFTSASPLSSTPWSNVTAPLTSQGTSCLNLPSETSSSSSVYDSAKEEFSPDFSFKVEDINEIGSKVGSTNISPVSINRKTSNAIATPTQLTTKSSPSKLVSFRHPPLDMIIICPTRVTQASGKSSPWPPLVSATSMASDNSSSWSWSWPSYKLQSRANSSMVSFQHQQPQVKGIRARIPSTLDSPPGVNIKSRSMSSLIKHQNGWLGFQLLDVRLIASGRCHIVVVTQSNQVYSCWETNNDKGGDILPDESNGQEIEETLGRSTKAQVATTFIQNTTCQPGLVQIQDDSSISWPSNIIKIVCSDNATFVLTECGDLWGWGFFEDMSDVISWGANEHGQLGRPCSSTKPTPSQGPSRGSSQDQTSSFDLSPYFIESLPPCMIGIGAGKLSSFAWDEERLYGWGDNTFGQLGRGPTLGAKFCRMQNQSKDIIANSSPVHNSERRDIVSIPREVPLHWKGRSLKQIQGGERHTIVLTLSGLVIAMGNDDFGQLGITSSASTPSAASPITTVSLSTPTSSSSSSPLTSQSSSETSAWFNSGSSSYAANNSSERSLAEFAATITKPKTRLFPALVRIGAGVKEIRCGDFHTVTCSDNGQMFAWGRGYDGILAIHNLQNNQEQVTLPSGRNVERGMELSNTTKVTTMSLIERTRRVAAISTMGSGVSIALVSND
ncbi:hypothetical protein BGX27_007678 [Mortierella sp. AM989]|nr:hypothetical protein BGX27_007678 [Mortierella sp. AM989]